MASKATGCCQQRLPGGRSSRAEAEGRGGAGSSEDSVLGHKEAKAELRALRFLEHRQEFRTVEGR